METRARDRSLVVGQEAGAFDFPAYIGRVRAALATAQASSPQDPAATLEKMRSLFEKLVADSEQLPPRIIEGTRQAFGKLADLTAVVREQEEEWSELAWFELSVRIWLQLYYGHLRETVGQGAADAAVTGIVNDVKCLTRKQRGRPRIRRVTDVVAAKRLRDQGLSLGQIATKNPTAFRDAKAVQLALRHDFPNQPLPSSDTDNSG